MQSTEKSSDLSILSTITFPNTVPELLRAAYPYEHANLHFGLLKHSGGYFTVEGEK